MTLTPEQSKTVASWVAAGDNLSAIQKKLFKEFQLSLTYMDVRFLVDDLNLSLKDPAPKASTDLAKGQAEGPDGGSGKKGFLEKAKEKLGLSQPAAGAAAELPEEEEADDFSPAGAGSVSVTVDKVTLLPGAVASGIISRVVTPSETRSSSRAAAQPKASWRGVRCPIMLSAVLIAL